MIESVKNGAALVFPVKGGELDDPLLQTFDNQTGGYRLSDQAPVREVRFFASRNRRRRPRPKMVERFANGTRWYQPGDQGGQVIRPSVLKAMAELRELVDREFPQ